MINLTNKWDKKVLNAYSLFVQESEKFKIDKNIQGTVSILTEVFLRYLIASTIDCMPETKNEIEYEDIHRAIRSDKGLLFLAGAFVPQVSLATIHKRRQPTEKPKRKRPYPEVIELD